MKKANKLKRLSSSTIMSFVWGIGLLLLSQNLQADETHTSQFHFRTGYLMGSVSGGLISSSLQIPVAVDLEYERFNTIRSSYYFTTSVSYDSGRGRVPFSYVGVGKRYYLSSVGTLVDATDGVQRVVVTPRFRYYLGGSVGFGQLVVKTVGASLEAESSLIALGMSLGGIYQITRSLGLEASVGVTGGLGFTAVAVNILATQAVFGVVYGF